MKDVLPEGALMIVKDTMNKENKYFEIIDEYFTRIAE